MSDSNELLNESTAIRSLRVELRRVTEALETLLADGFPMRPMSGNRTGVKEWEEWHLDMETRIRDAHKALAQTEKFNSET